MSYQIEHPHILWLLLIVIPLALIAWKSLSAMEPVRRFTIIIIRALIITIAVFALSGLTHITKNNRLAVIALVDVSGSIRRFAHLPRISDLQINPNINNNNNNNNNSNPIYNLEYIRWWLQQANQTRKPDDLFGMLVFDGKPYAITTPVTGDYNDDNIDVQILEGTNIEQAVKYGLAMFPPNAARRLVLITDGVETSGNILSTDSSANNSLSINNFSQSIVPIDVIPISYSAGNEIIVQRVDVPAHARPDQRITVRIPIKSTYRTQGRLSLLHENQSVDLNGPNNPGTSRLIQLQPGLNVETADITLGNQPINRFTAVFEPIDNNNNKHDTMSDNNIAEAFTITHQKGSVLILDGVYDKQGYPLTNLLENANLYVKSITPSALTTNLLELQAYDLIIMQNVAADDLSTQQQEMIDRYVQDLGGGLIMIGGYDALGAGGWHLTETRHILPVDLKIPEELRVPTAAIAIVLDCSGSMAYPVMGTTKNQQEIANEGAVLAIETLDPLDYVTVVRFNSSAHTVVPLQIVSKVDNLDTKIRNISPGGGTNMLPAMTMAYESLLDVDAEIKHVVCLTDGQSQDGNFEELADQMRKFNITISTIAVGDGADIQTLSNIAMNGGGEFYQVSNPRVLPRIFVKDIRVLRRPLIREKDFTPVITPTGKTSSITRNLGKIPPLKGLVLTQPLPNPEAEILMQAPTGEPILAKWIAGLGRVAVFTSDAHNKWAANWLTWPGYITLWTQLTRAIARPPGMEQFELQTILDDDDNLRITLNASSLNLDTTKWLTVTGVVYTPDNQAINLRLRQTGPSTYTTSINAELSGNYVVALNPQLDNQNLGLVVGGTTKRAGLEYRRLVSNTKLVQQISEITKGRLLDINNPTAIDLYDRKNLPPSTGAVPLWPALLWILLPAFLLDITTRRIAWDRFIIKAAILRIYSQIAQAGKSRGAQAAATTTTLRQADLQQKQQQELAHAKFKYDSTKKSETDISSSATTTNKPLYDVIPDTKENSNDLINDSKSKLPPKKPTVDPIEAKKARLRAIKALNRKFRVPDEANNKTTKTTDKSTTKNSKDTNNQDTAPPKDSLASRLIKHKKNPPPPPDKNQK